MKVQLIFQMKSKISQRLYLLNLVYSFQRELICAIITTYLERIIEDLGSVIDGWLTYCNHLNKKSGVQIQ